MTNSNDQEMDSFQYAPSFESWPESDKFINRSGVEIHSGLYLKDRKNILNAIMNLNTEKLDKLIAGEGISIDGDTISATNSFTISSSGGLLTITPTTSDSGINYDIEMNAPLTVSNGGTGSQSLTGLIKGNGTDPFSPAIAGTDYLTPDDNVGNADKLTTPRNLQTDLGILTTQLFDGSEDATSIGIKGILPQGNGGTGLSSFEPEEQYELPYASSTTVTDLNSLTTGKYFITASQTIANAPFTSTNYFVYQFGLSNSISIQLAYSADSSSNSYRTKSGSTWSSWGNTVATSASSDKLTTARSLGTDLSSTTLVTFDGSADQNSIPVSGILPVANGGTGAATLTGLIKGSGTNALAPAIAGVDYLAPSSDGSITIQNSSSAPTAPASGGILYVSSGALMYIGSSGTITTIAPA